MQPRFPQIGPAGDGPRAIFCAQSGMGKTSAALKMMEEYLRICERVYIISSTINLDPNYTHMKELIKKKYQEEDVDIDDPEENPRRRVRRAEIIRGPLLSHSLRPVGCVCEDSIPRWG